MRQLARLLDAFWYLTLGLYLGLSAGAVLAVILAFRISRSDTVLARPGAQPYADPRFEPHWPDYVAGAIGNQLFAIAGIAILILIALATLTMFARLTLVKTPGGSKTAWTLRILSMLTLAVALGLATPNVRAITQNWQTMYDLESTDAQLADARERLESLHQKSDRLVRVAWLAGAFALIVSPWCVPYRDPTPADSAA